MIDPVEDFDTTPEPDKTRFRVTTDSEAAWAMRKLRSIKNRIAEIDQIAADEKARIEAWRIAQGATHLSDEAYFTGILTEYGYYQRADHDRKSVSTPHGTIKSRTNPAKWTVDEDFVTWAKVHAPEFVRVKEEPNLVEMKKILVVADSDVVNPVDGRIIPGVVVHPGDTVFSIEVEL